MCVCGGIWGSLGARLEHPKRSVIETLISAPAAKAFSLPVIITQPIVGSFSKVSMAVLTSRIYDVRGQLSGYIKFSNSGYVSTSGSLSAFRAVGW